MSERARKRQRGGPSQWSEAPPFWNDDPASILQPEGLIAGTSTSLPLQTATLVAADTFRTEQPSSCLFPTSGPLPDFSGRDVFVPDSFFPPFGSNPLWALFQDNPQAYFGVNGQTTLGRDETSAEEPWQSVNGVPDALQPAGTRDVDDSLTAAGYIWSDASMHTAGGGWQAGASSVVNVPSFQKLKRGP